MPKLSFNNRIAALNDAVDFLEMQESESDVEGDRDARIHLAAELHRRAERLKIQREYAALRAKGRVF